MIDHNRTQPVVTMVQLRVPPFCRNTAQVRRTRLKVQFHLDRIATWSYNLLSFLPQDVAEDVVDVVAEPLGDMPCQRHKYKTMG